MKTLQKLMAALCSLLILMTSCKSNSHNNSTGQTVPEEEKPVKTLKVLSYNICEAMKHDAEFNYDHFVEWVNEQDPDIFCIEEANNLDESKLAALAVRWGHKHIVTNCGHVWSHYPVAMTSRYEIQGMERITENDGVFHGGIHAVINGIDVLVLHLYPFKEIRDVVRWENKIDLDGDHDIDGDDYRVREIDIYMEKTIKKYPERNWLMMGDFNSVSPLDKVFYTNEDAFVTHEHVLKEYKDLVKIKHESYQRSAPTIRYGWKPGVIGRRIDFMYGTQSMANKLIRADFIHDEFTEQHSDHYPIMAEFAE